MNRGNKHQERYWAKKEKELEARNSKEMFSLDHTGRYTGIELLDLLADVPKK